MATSAYARCAASRLASVVLPENGLRHHDHVGLGHHRSSHMQPPNLWRISFSRIADIRMMSPEHRSAVGRGRSGF